MDNPGLSAAEAKLSALQQTMDAQALARNVREVQSTLAQNCYKDNPPAKLVAVTKTVSASVIGQLKPLGVLDIAENRAQVAAVKFPQLSQDFQLHWIGRLQTNKVKYIMDYVCMLHTLDRMHLAQEVDRRGAMVGRVIPVLVQVNIAGEAQKAGLPAGGVRPFLKEVKSLPNLCVRGLMSMMPLEATPGQLTTWFRGMRTLFEEIREEAINGIHMEELSMGMSQDYAIAAREGATMVRVGGALFKQP